MDESWLDFMSRPAVVETFVDLLLCSVPIWVAIMIGLVIGWSWRPRWTSLVFLGFRSKLRFVWTAVPPGIGVGRLWFALSALSAFSVGRRLWFSFMVRKCRESGAALAPESVAPGQSVGSGSEIEPSTGSSEAIQCIVTQKDLEHLLHLLDGKDGQMVWQNLMEHSTSNMTYQAWRHEQVEFDHDFCFSITEFAEKVTIVLIAFAIDFDMSPIVYRTRTVFEDATPELVRDFFWDDEFRPKWDTMLAYFKILEECPHTGTMTTHWIKKFPLLCSDREYIIGRRIWEAGKAYYCVTKGVPYPALQRQDKPRRVDRYFSSWIIKPVLSCKGDGLLSACEVTLVHHEDMGIPKDVAKLGVRHGMWGTVKKLHAGFRAYQQARKLEAPLSRSALLARITTKIQSSETAYSLEPVPTEEEEVEEDGDPEKHGDHGGIDWKWIVIGGTVALVCGFHTGVIGRALLLGAGQRVARR
ncbi:unnamed protein product [Ilex paraguariensis]|uniref:START domain-containing protein n=1 Tax=Ilex paraguariensis TaxID=185542 RepID=A0ABC8QVQ1_9AQUA